MSEGNSLNHEVTKDTKPDGFKRVFNRGSDLTTEAPRTVRSD